MTLLATGDSRPDQAWKLPSRLGRAPQDVPARGKWKWPLPVALLAWVVYSAAAVWMTEIVHLQIGDSIARMADARAMLFSRDPHLAAVGLYWMPLPTVGQLPFMFLLSPLHHAELSGPLACAFVGALTVLVMARICWVLELSKPVSIAFTLVFAFNPIVIYTNGNGMSEAWSFLACAITMIGFLRWSRHHRTTDLALLALGLASVALVRYEGLVLAPMIAVLTALNDGRDPPNTATVRQFLRDCRGRVRRWATTAALVAVPTYFILALWMFMQYVLVRDPLYWYKLQKSHGHTTPGTYSGLPAHTIFAVAGYNLKLLLLVAPAVAVVAPTLLFRRRYGDILTGMGILAGALVWPAIVAIGLLLNESAGAPRYFEPSILFLVVGAIWLAAHPPSWRGNGHLSRGTTQIVSVALIATLAVSALAGTINLENPRLTTIEKENHFFSSILGHHVPSLAPSELSQPVLWKIVAQDLDGQLAHGHLVLADVSADGTAYVYTRYPGRYIINSDRDYQRTLADPTGKFDFIIQNHAPDRGHGDNATQIDTIVANTTGGHWVKWRDYYTATVFQWIPDLPGPA